MQHVDEGRLHAWLDGELPAGGPDGARALERHLAGCAACRARVEEERTIREAASAILRGADPGPPRVIPIASAPSAPRGRRTWVALGWAASVLLALGVGWIARPQPRDSIVLAPAPAPRAPAPAQPGAPSVGLESAQVPASPAPAPQDRAERPAAAQTAPSVSAPSPAPDAAPVAAEEVRGTGSMGEVLAAAPPPPPPSASPPRPPPPPAAEVPMPAPAPVAGRVERMAEAAATPPPPDRPRDSLTVRGRVVDASGQGVPGATVSVPALAARTTTRVDGSYTLSVPASRLEGSDSIRVIASRVGLEVQSRSLDAEAEAATANFALQPSAVALEGLVVTPKAPAERRREVASSAARVTPAGEWRAAGRAEAERSLGSPLFTVPGLPVLGIELRVVEGSPAARVKQRLPGGEVLTLTQRRASAARARQPSAPAGTTTVRRGSLTVEAAAPIPADSLGKILGSEQ